MKNVREIINKQAENIIWNFLVSSDGMSLGALLIHTERIGNTITHKHEKHIT
jgi:hypothetical protein